MIRDSCEQMASHLTHIQCATALTRKRVDNMRPQTFGNSVLKGEKVEKTLGWTKDETNVDVGKGGFEESECQ